MPNASATGLGVPKILVAAFAEIQVASPSSRCASLVSSDASIPWNHWCASSCSVTAPGSPPDAGESHAVAPVKSVGYSIASAPEPAGGSTIVRAGYG
ncbi:MAG: hypothetical protein IPF66_15850 [Holophagales bacterium]|nr:hypothetical protein [Holophagales bacterium]